MDSGSSKNRDEGMRSCVTCHEEKPIENFRTRVKNRGYYVGECFECRDIRALKARSRMKRKEQS